MAKPSEATATAGCGAWLAEVLVDEEEEEEEERRRSSIMGKLSLETERGLDLNRINVKRAFD